MTEALQEQTTSNIQEKKQTWGFKKGQSGNPKGRPKGLKDCFSMERFYEAIKAVEEEKRESFFKHAISRAWENDKVLVAILNKVLPNVEVKTEDKEKWENEEIVIVNRIEITPEKENRFQQFMN